MTNLYQLMPNIAEEEMLFVKHITAGMTDNQLEQFAIIYNSRRKDPQTILLLALIGFLGISGVHRFVLEQIGMGLLYLFTGGLCLIGTIVDLVNHKRLAFEYNETVARRTAQIVGHPGA